MTEVEALDTETVDTGPVDTETVDTEVTDTTTTSTSTTSTSTTTTTEPPPEPLQGVVSVEEVPIFASSSDVKSIADHTLIDAERGPRLIVVGSWRIEGETGLRALVHRGGQTNDGTLPTFDDTIESYASSITSEGATATVGGTVIGADGVAVPVIWTSTDATQTFTDPEVVRPGPGSVIATSRAPGVTYLVVSSLVDEEYRLDVAVRSDGGEWRFVPLEPSGRDMGGGDVVVSGGTVVVTTTSEVDGRRRIDVHTSTDGGVTFTRSTDDSLAALDAIGEMTVLGDRIRAVGAPADDSAPLLLDTVDGVSWSSVPIRSDDPAAAFASASFVPGPIIEVAGLAPEIQLPIDAQFAIGFSDPLGRLGLVTADGRGLSFTAPFSQEEVWFEARPAIVGGELLIVGDSTRDFAVYNIVDDELMASSARGPLPTRVDLIEGDGDGTLVADVARYPVVEPVGERAFEYSGESSWAVRGDGGWELDPSYVPDGTFALITSGEMQLALSRLDDATDGTNDGPIGAVGASIRSGDEEWPGFETISAGPGGQSVEDASASEDGFAMLVDDETQSDDGSRTSAVEVWKYSAGQWTEASVELGLGDRVSGGFLRVADDGPSIMTGTWFDGSRFPTFFASPGDDGVWRPVEATTDDGILDVFDIRSTADSIEIVARRDDDWLVLSTMDGVTFEETPLDLDGPFPTVAALVDVDDRRVVVGSTSDIGQRRLVLWELDDDGVGTPIELDETPAGVGLSVDDVALDDGGAIVIGGVFETRAVAWTITLS